MFHRDEAPFHTATIGLMLQANHKIQTIKNKLHSPDLLMTDYFLLTRGKDLPYFIRLTQEAMNTSLDGV